MCFVSSQIFDDERQWVFFCTNDVKCHVLCHLSSLPYQRCRGLTALNGSIYLYLPTFFKLNVCCHDRYLQKHPADFQRFLTTFQRLPNGAENIRRCSKTVWQGAKKVTFTACHSGKLKLTFSSPNIISTSPRNGLMSRLICSSLIWIPQKTSLARQAS